jgi:hypothetical protein
MLWTKGWLETRIRLAFALGVVALTLVFLYSLGLKPPANGAQPMVGIVGIATIFVAMMSGMLAGAGINTQPSFQATKGLHGSMLFTLSLPVSRFRLLAVRVSLGWLELVLAIGTLCCGMWAVFPMLRATATAVEMLEYAAVLLACASGLHFISVLLATFLDDQWRMFGSIISFGVVWWLCEHTPVPAFANIFRAMTEGSPLIAHSIPWTTIAFSLSLAVVLFCVALKVVRTREY